MGITGKMLFSVVILHAILYHIDAHVYDLGECINVEPLHEFHMDKFLGKWYAIEKITTSNKCLTYDFTTTNVPGEYRIEQVSKPRILGMTRENDYHYTGTLKAEIPQLPAKMSVKFPLNVAGSASFVVFMTDYRTYAAIYTCQNLPLSHRYSVTILSRNKQLDVITKNQIYSKLYSFNVNPSKLRQIDHSNCDFSNTASINITKESFSPKSIGDLVRKGGNKVGDGAEYLANGVVKATNYLKDKYKPQNQGNQERVLLSNVPHSNINDANRNSDLNNIEELDPDVEWI